MPVVRPEVFTETDKVVLVKSELGCTFSQPDPHVLLAAETWNVND